ncbi:response regulator [Stackebrandtia nassauensis]|uniref:Two component transcriptional regulator, LuxR family n=1 Tax=Stackebrandtia nassauensis (strain DSM 44728 / CIP 108903 / NRRL B-16338 / NBRC 102104 / LLR-40K-21) TaxID=446470 RepID=D3PXK3_STANL|nr:response regulator transcription factor [Stackebrandtia nassauensis]ADD43333.1 two component transcriptional regulator, LuxR family [Stackebrandtia nassauensis DSM 44728]
MIRVLLVDDQRLIRAGLRMLCEPAADIEVVGEADGGQAAVRLAGELCPDLVLMDLRMPGMDGITATQRILAERPSTRVVALTTFDDDDHLYPALAAGACGFLVKDTSPNELLEAIRKAADGDTPFSAGVVKRIVDSAVRARASVPTATLPKLTTREREVLALVGAGYANVDIAERLHLGVTTVKTHIASLMTKTGCSNRVRLAVLAVRSGTTTE